MTRVVVVVAAVLLSAQAPAVRPLTIEQLIEIRHPSAPVWSPDSRRVAYVSERAGIANIYVDSRPVTAFADGVAGGMFWSADSQRVYFPRGGDLWQVSIGGGQPSAVWTTAAAETAITPSPDRTRVAFVRNREIFVRALGDGHDTRIARSEDSIGGLAWTPDGQHIVFAAGAETIRHEQTPAYSGSKIIYTISERKGVEPDAGTT